MPKRATVDAGKLGEDYALLFLKRKGYKILFRNFHSKFGEVDVVARDGKELVFVEVKTRWSKNFGHPAEAVNPRKLKHLTRTVDYFRLLHPDAPQVCRIDVVATEVKDGRVVRAQLLKNVTGF